MSQVFPVPLLWLSEWGDRGHITGHCWDISILPSDFLPRHKPLCACYLGTRHVNYLLLLSRYAVRYASEVIGMRHCCAATARYVVAVVAHTSYSARIYKCGVCGVYMHVHGIFMQHPIQTTPCISTAAGIPRGKSSRHWPHTYARRRTYGPGAGKAGKQTVQPVGTYARTYVR
jgi:hypothetical protein